MESVAGRPPRAGTRTAASEAVLGALLVLALALVAWFDLATSLPLSDEWMFWFPLMSAAGGHGFELWPGVLPLALPQLVLALPMEHADPRLWRLLEIPALLAVAYLVRRLGLRVGANPRWASAAAVCVVCNPVMLSVATGFTSDIVYIALLLGAATAAVDWVENGRCRKTCIALALLATLQRQHGVAIAPVVVLALVALSPRRLDTRDRVHALVLVLLTALALGAPLLLGLRSSTMSSLATGRGSLHAGLGPSAGALMELGPMLGLGFLPLGAALLQRRDGEGKQNSRWALLPTGLGAAGVVAAGMFALVFGTTILPGNVFGNWGLGPLHLGGAKPNLLPLPAFFAVEALVTLASAVILVHRRFAWVPGRLGAAATLLVLLALAHLPFMAFTSPLDRYYLPVLALLAPPIALAASAKRTVRGTRLASAWLGVALCAGVAYYAAGEQDFQAWQQAREQAALRAYAAVSPARVEAGYEAVAMHAAVPEYFATRRTSISPIDLRALDPVLRLEFRTPGSGGDGVDYRSVASGRIVVVPARSR